MEISCFQIPHSAGGKAGSAFLLQCCEDSSSEVEMDVCHLPEERVPGTKMSACARLPLPSPPRFVLLRGEVGCLLGILPPFVEAL